MAILAWLATQCYKVSRNDYSTETKETLSGFLGEEFPVYTVNSQQVTVASKISPMTRLSTITEPYRYLSVVYVQTNYDQGSVIQLPTFYNSTSCANTYEDNDARAPVLENYLCPELPDETFQIQGEPGMREEYSQKTFTMLVGTCTDLSDITKNTNCYTNAEVKDVADQLEIEIQVLTEYLNEHTSDFQTTTVNNAYERKYQRYGVLSGVDQVIQIQIQK